MKKCFNLDFNVIRLAMFELESDQAKSFRKARNSKTKVSASHKPINYGRYKTEMCRQYSENGECKYGDKCQFAHGLNELKDVNRHPKYKTDFCKTFHSKGFCPYGPRCHFIHDTNDKLELKDESSLFASVSQFDLTPPLPQHQNLVFNLANSASSCSSSSSSQSPSPSSYLVSSSRSSLFENEFNQFNPINSHAINQLNQLINSLLSINMGQSVPISDCMAPTTPITSCKNR